MGSGVSALCSKHELVLCNPHHRVFEFHGQYVLCQGAEVALHWTATFCNLFDWTGRVLRN